MLKWLVILISVMAAPLQAQDVLRNNSRDTLNTLPPPPLQIYMIVNGEQLGPLNEEQFKTYLVTPEAAASTYVWIPGMAEWLLASNVPQLQGIIASIGQPEDNDSGTFTVADINAYMLGVWISEQFTWTLQDKPYSAIIQMKLLPNGQFEGATIMWDQEKDKAEKRIYHEKGTWTATKTEDGMYNFVRNMFYTAVVEGAVVGNGQLEDSMILGTEGPNALKSVEGIDLVRVPDAN